MIKIFEPIKKKWHYWRATRKFKNRTVTRAQFLYKYLIISGIAAALYAISCIYTGLPYILAITPVVGLLAWWTLTKLYKNWRVIWLYLTDKDRGRLLLFLTERTHFEPDHMLRVVKWIYLSTGYTRMERILELAEKVKAGTKLTDREMWEAAGRGVSCPQQLLDGVNKAILVWALIYAHTNIQVLDSNLRAILELTDENMMKFDLNAEIDRCRKSEQQQKIDKYTKIGMDNLNTQHYDRT